jgi:hypothetical protein
MVARMVSPALIGLDTATVEVEVDLRAGLPGFSVVGLPDAAVQEARERVRSGLVNQAFDLPARRIVANLAPADLRKGGPQYDLPVALTILSASGQIRPGALAGTGAVGELALDGALRPVAGAVVMAEHAARRGWRQLVVPDANAAEASLVPGIRVLGARTLRHAVDVLERRTDPVVVSADAADLLHQAVPESHGDLAEVRGQGDITRSIADLALNLLDVDERGFDHQDRRLLLTMIEKFDGGPVGVDNLAAAISEERHTIEDVLEPYLIQQGYIMRTPRGRIVTRHAYLHFGLNVPKRMGDLPAADLFGGDND